MKLAWIKRLPLVILSAKDVVVEFGALCLIGLINAGKEKTIKRNGKKIENQTDPAITPL